MSISSRFPFTFLCVILLSCQVFAQSAAPFIEVEPDGLSNLSPVQMDRYTELIAYVDAHTDAPYSQEIVRINSLSGSNEEGFISIYSGLDCAETQFLINHIEYKEDDNYILWAEPYWEGEIEEDKDHCAGASFYLQAYEGAFYGEISYTDVEYKVYDIGQGLCLLIGYEVLENDECYVRVANGSNSSNQGLNSSGILDSSVGGALSMGIVDPPPSDCSMLGGGCIIDIRIFFTNASLSTLGFFRINPTQFARSKVAFFNKVARRSSTSGNYPSLRLVGISVLPLVETSFQEYGDFLDGITSYTRSYSEDLFHVIANIWTGSVGINGLAWRGFNGAPAPAYANTSSSIFNPFVSSNQTFAHEVGHNLGADHEVRTRPGENASNLAKVFNYKNCWLCRRREAATIMYGSIVRKERISYFSNPQVTVYGKSIGDQGARENQNYIEQNKCTVAGYKPPVDFDYYEIRATTRACEGDLLVLSACYAGSCANCTYKWYFGVDGINWNLVNQQNGFTVTIGSVPPGGILRTKLEVHNGTNTFTRYHNIQVYPANFFGLGCILAKNGTVSAEPEPAQEVEVYPNPVVGDVLTIEFGKMPLQEVEIELLNTNLEVLHQQRFKLVGTPKVLFEVGDLPKGFYLLRIRDEDKERILKIIVP